MQQVWKKIKSHKLTARLKIASGAVIGVIAILSLAKCKLVDTVDRNPDAHSRYIVTLKDEVEPESFARQRPNKLGRKMLKVINGYVDDLSESEAKALKKERQVLFVERDSTIVASPVSNLVVVPPPTQFGLKRMNLSQFPLAHLNHINEPLNVDVAVVDSGIDPHEDLDTSDDRTFITFGVDGSDALGHGTAVAGIIAAHDDNVGVAGVASGVRLWNIKVIGPPPENSWTNMLSGLNFVYEHAAEIDVVNISINNDGPGTPVNSLQGAIRRLVRAGVVVVNSAGNFNQDIAGLDGQYKTADDVFPASFPEVMAVSAMDPTYDTSTSPPHDVFWKDSESVGTNFSQAVRPIPTDNPDPTVVYPHSSGGAIDLAAPGVNIVTTAARAPGDMTVSNLYAYQKGTSMAAPHVTGLVALYIAANGRAHDEKGVYKIRQAIIDASEKAQPQSTWASYVESEQTETSSSVPTPGTLDPDSNHEALAYPPQTDFAAVDWVPRPHLSYQMISGAMHLTANTAASAAACADVPCSIPGYQYDFVYKNDLNETVWQPLTSLLGDGNVLEAIDSNLNTPQRFWNVEVKAAP